MDWMDLVDTVELKLLFTLSIPSIKPTHTPPF